MQRRVLSQIAAAVVTGAVLGVVLHTMGVGASTGGPGAGEVGTEVAGVRVARDVQVPEQVVAAAQRSVLWVEASGCGEVRQASATVLRHGGQVVVLTNAHVVRGAGTVTLRDSSGNVVAAEVLGAVAGRDAAVLEVLDAEGAAWQDVEPLTTGPAPEVGAPVVVAGHPDGHVSARTGQVDSVERRAGFGGASDVFVVDTPVRGGNSGGALLDEQGRAVGLVAAKDPVTGGGVAYPIAEVLDRATAPVPSC